MHDLSDYAVSGRFPLPSLLPLKRRTPAHARPVGQGFSWSRNRISRRAGYREKALSCIHSLGEVACTVCVKAWTKEAGDDAQFSDSYSHKKADEALSAQITL